MVGFLCRWLYDANLLLLLLSKKTWLLAGVWPVSCRWDAHPGRQWIVRILPGKWECHWRMLQMAVLADGYNCAEEELRAWWSAAGGWSGQLGPGWTGVAAGGKARAGGEAAGWAGWSWHPDADGGQGCGLAPADTHNDTMRQRVLVSNFTKLSRPPGQGHNVIWR